MNESWNLERDLHRTSYTGEIEVFYPHAPTEIALLRELRRPVSIEVDRG